MRISPESIRRLHQMQASAPLAPRPAADLAVRLGGGDHGTPLFLVHPVGGGITCYLPLVLALQAPFPIYGLRHPGLTSGETSLGLPELAQRYLTAVRGLTCGSGYRLGGWSLGGVVASLMAAQIEAGGERVDFLLLIDSPTVTAEGYFYRSNDMFEEAAGQTRENRQAALQDLGRVEAQLRDDAESLAATRAIYFSNAEALAKCRLTSAVRSIHYVAAGNAAQHRGWQRFARERLESRDCTGNHYSIMEPPHVDALAQVCRAWLDASADGADTGG